jgi:hypothetical protein
LHGCAECYGLRLIDGRMIARELTA